MDLFSVGVEKANNRQELEAVLSACFKNRHCYWLRNFFIRTLTGASGVEPKPIYACRYYMVRNRWPVISMVQNRFW